MTMHLLEMASLRAGRVTTVCGYFAPPDVTTAVITAVTCQDCISTLIYDEPAVDRKAKLDAILEDIRGIAEVLSEDIHPTAPVDTTRDRVETALKDLAVCYGDLVHLANLESI